MIPTRNSPRYKILLRIRTDIWGNLKKKALHKKKWRLLRKIRPKRISKKLRSSEVTSLSKFPVRYRFFFKQTLLYKQTIKIYYGCLQDYKLKAIARSCKKGGGLAFINKIEHKLVTVLQRLKLTRSNKESLVFCAAKYVFLSGSTSKKNVEKGDVLHFSSAVIPLFQRRFKRNRRNFIPTTIDFDVEGFRFLFLGEIKFYSFPFTLQFRRIWRWYSV